MTDSEFNECIEVRFQQIEEVFDEHDYDIDVENTGGVLTIEFENNSTIVLSRQIANHQLWLAARSGGYHFEFVDSQWQCTRSGRPFNRALSEECLQQASLRLVYSGNRSENFISADSSAWSASINYSHLQFMKDLPLSLDARLGWLNTAKIRGISHQNNSIWFATLASQWQFAERTALKLQLDAHGAIADSRLDALGSDAVMLSVRLNRQLTPQWSVEFAADVSFLFSIRYGTK